MFTYEGISRRPAAFRSLTGFCVREFDDLYKEIESRYEAAKKKRLYRPGKKRAPGTGRKFRKTLRERLLMALIWLHICPTYEVLGLLFSLHKSDVCRNLKQMLSLLEEQTQFELVQPRADQKPKSLEQVLADFPDLGAILDATEQRIQRPKGKQKPYYSGKKKAHTIKTQIVVNKMGRIGLVSDSVPGSEHDLTLARESDVLNDSPEEIFLTVDNAYHGLERDDPGRRIELPFRRFRGHPLTEEEKAFDRDLSRRRIVVEHALARMKHLQILAKVYRHAIEIYNFVFRIIAGLVNRLQRQRALAQRLRIKFLPQEEISIPVVITQQI